MTTYLQVPPIELIEKMGRFEFGNDIVNEILLSSQDSFRFFPLSNIPTLDSANSMTASVVKQLEF